MKTQIPVDPGAEATWTSPKGPNSRLREVGPDLAYKRLAIVNAVFYGVPGAGDGQWVLIDAGIPGSTGALRRAAAERFGSRPAAILLTHGHFDHVGALAKLADFWDVPIYAHALEHPFLNGTTAYEAGDPSVGGGLMSALSPLYPRGPIDVSRRLRAFVEGEVPGMPGWTWLHTPGHSPGHISFWRPTDRALITGDAFITTNQESAYSVATQRPELHGPPQYFTPDWAGAGLSVRRLADLRPEVVITGHGIAMQGPRMQEALQQLARNFADVAVPNRGRYAQAAA